MKIYIDTADIDEIEEAFSWGIVSGITTNPSLIKKALEKHKGSCGGMEDYITEILEIAGKNCPVSLEVIGIEENDMIDQGKKLYNDYNDVADNVIIKIPINPVLSAKDKNKYDGLKAITELSGSKIPVNATLIMAPEQALLAAEAGARYVSPFAGRIDDLLKKKEQYASDEKWIYYPAKGRGIDDNGIVSGVDLVAEIVGILKKYDDDVEVIAASIRNPRQVREVALAGADIATIPFKVLGEMIYHQKTEEGMKKFTDDVAPEYAALFE